MHYEGHNLLFSPTIWDALVEVVDVTVWYWYGFIAIIMCL